MDTGLQTPGIKTIVESYLPAFEQLLRLIDQDAIERIVESLSTARENGAMIYVAGNGGSAAIASHWVNDLGKATKRSGSPPIRVMSLNDNVSWLTALANDEGYERVFSGQLENFAKPGDVLVVISSSGNSVNLIRAVELARTRGLVSIGLLGFDRGKLKNQLDDYLLLPTEKGLRFGRAGASVDLSCCNCVLGQGSASGLRFQPGAVSMSATYQRQSRQRPTQAVILAGGRGTRLRPLTDTRPKPMIEIHGKPFLEYLVEMLATKGLIGFCCCWAICRRWFRTISATAGDGESQLSIPSPPLTMTQAAE